LLQGLPVIDQISFVRSPHTGLVPRSKETERMNDRV